MGWCSGSELAENIYNEIRKFIPEHKRKEIAKKIYDEFCNYDADDWTFSNLTEDSGEVILCPECKQKTWADCLENDMCEECNWEENQVEELNINRLRGE